MMLRRIALMGITPNMVSVFGLAVSLMTAVCLAVGADASSARAPL